MKSNNQFIPEIHRPRPKCISKNISGARLPAIDFSSKYYSFTDHHSDFVICSQGSKLGFFSRGPSKKTGGPKPKSGGPNMYTYVAGWNKLVALGPRPQKPGAIRKIRRPMDPGPPWVSSPVLKWNVYANVPFSKFDRICSILVAKSREDAKRNRSKWMNNDYLKKWDFRGT